MLKRRATKRAGEPVTYGEFARWWRRAEIAFVFLTLVSAGSAWLSYKAGQESDRNLRSTSADTVYRSCESRWEGRLTTVRALDDLRLSALRKPRSGREAILTDQFVTRTQVPLDALLTQAAGYTVNTPPGKLQPSTYAQVSRDAHAACLRQRASFARRARVVGE